MLILLLFEFALSTYRSDHALSISFAAPWSPVRIVDQMFSFLLQYSNEAAKIFLYNVTSNKGEKMNDEEYLWDVAKNILPSTFFSIMKANVDFGSTIPSSIFNGFNSSSYTKEINFSSTQRFQTDFVSYGKSDNINEAYNNIIYADIQNESERIHNLLADEVPFVLRSTPISTGNKSKVRGYGIELRPFKYSMEYNVKNRAENNDDTQSTINITDETTLRLPSEFEENLTSLSYENIESKFSKYLKENSDKKNYTKLLRDITSNWPLYLKSITETNPDSEYTNELHSYIDPRFMQSYLNGRHFSVDHSDSFTFLQMINEEQTLNEILRSEFDCTESQIEWFTTTRLLDQKIHFFDFRTEFINFYNDIEKDDKYRNWPTDVRILSNYRKVMPRLRKNVINAVLYFDPTTIDGMNEFISLLFLTMNMYPITAGIIPIFRMNDQLSRKVGFAYHHLTLNNPKEGMNFLIKAFNYIEKDKETGAILRITEEAFAKAYEEVKSTKKNKKKWSNLNELYTQNSIEYKTIQKVAKYYDEKNLKIDTVSINGMIYTAPSNANNYMEFIFKSFSLIVPIFMNFKNDKKVMSNHVIDTIIEEGSYPVTDKIDRKIFTNEIDSLDVHSLSHKDQFHFLNELNEIEWYNLNQNEDNDDNSMINTYAIILSGSHLNESLSFDEKGFTVLDEFIQKQNKKETKSQILFAVDPTSSDLLNSKLLSFIPITNYPLLIINGRIIQKFNYTDINEYLQADMWNYDYVIKNYEHSMMNKVEEKANKNKNKLLNFYLATISNSWRGSQIQRGFINVFMITNQNPLRFTKNVEGALELTLIINPFKRNFQRFCGLIEYMESHEILSFNMILNPSFSESDDMQTLSSFYRSSTNNDDVVFTHLNDRTTYSSLIDVPNSWQAESLSSLFDLDNILLSELAPKVHTAEYVLTNIIVEGSCKTVDGFPASGWPLSIQPPNSLLPSELKSHDYYNQNYACKSDTLVMEPQNGYFQLMGTIGPNVISYSKSGDSKSGIFVEVNGFALKKTKIVLNGVKKSDLKTKDKNENKLYANSSRIDVFGVASGHLYERLIKIMMLSVKRHTEPRTDVTFWLLNNFLSPQFKSVLPQMAAKYEFKYKLVKYKWPSWIYPQFEKQRIIWGNKILFLDVLFPLDLNRVIYVDSDQIVRTDLTELMKMDFENAPYAFTPFCDSRQETEPYRFWKKGFWKVQLQEMAYVYQKDGKVPEPLKYHISALFAIDLNRFRQLNGGDVLRLLYNSLAPDKQSLANLDQDLPNFAQNVLKIFSLPQEWLWCETWCSDDSMDKAKTIDLCNNPLTKKPKLEIAQTRVKEWPGLDKEVSEILASRDEYEKMFFK